MKVSVVIPNYNGQGLLKKNLPWVIAAQKNPENEISEIIIVDDGSSDQSVSLIKAEFPLIRLIKHSVNRGFPAAANTGVRSARNELVCLLNTDVLPSVNFLESIQRLFRYKRLFAVSLNEEGYSWAKSFFKDGFVGHRPGVATEKTHSTFWVSGGSGVFRRNIWNSLGGFDEKLLSPFYWEDLDLSYRAQKRGYVVLWDPNAKVTHEHESTVSKLRKGYVNRIRERNQLLFIWKNITSPRLTRQHVKGLIKRIFRHPRYIFVFLSALKKFRQVLKARKKEKREGKVSDEAIFAKYK